MTGVSADLQYFLELSAELTGFETFDLFATDQALAYRDLAQGKIGGSRFEALLAIWRELRDASPTARRAGIQARIFSDDPLKPAAERIILLWYTGVWFDENLSHGAVVASQTYVEGLVWRAIGAHPLAAKGQGFGAWASPPAGVHLGHSDAK